MVIQTDSTYKPVWISWDSMVIECSVSQCSQIKPSKVQREVRFFNTKDMGAKSLCLISFLTVRY